eukprot:g1415.t1
MTDADNGDARRSGVRVPGLKIRDVEAKPVAHEDDDDDAYERKAKLHSLRKERSKGKKASEGEERKSEKRRHEQHQQPLWLPDWSDDEQNAVMMTLSVAGAWRGPVQISSIAIVRDLKKMIASKSGIKVSYQRLSIKDRKGMSIVLDDDYRSLRSYGVQSRFRVLCINAKPNEDARLLRLKMLREKKKKRKHETLKAKLERQKRRAQRKQQLSDWSLDAEGNLLRKGRVTMPDGAVYDGEWRNQKRHGKGVLVDVNGDRYEGSFEDGVPHGFGTRIYAFDMIDGKFVKDGRKYEGEWKFGVYWGEGEYTIGNGETYKGGFHDGLCHGTGTYRYKNGDVYEGLWKMNRRCGQGTMQYLNGDRYEGSWKMDMFEGPGRFVRKRAGEMRGMFRMGVLHGKATRVYADGRVFEGEFYHGDRRRGRLQITSDEWYEGEWERGFQHGRGYMRWRDGTTYEGEWMKGYPCGKGRMTYIDGGFYEGEFKMRTDPKRYSHGMTFPRPNGLRHGFGVRVYASGSVYRGEWRDGLPHGRGIFEDKGSRYEGAFVRGEKCGLGTCYFFPIDNSADSYICPCGWYHRDLLPSTQKNEIQLLNNGSEKRDVTSSKMNETVADKAFRFDSGRTCIYKGEWKAGAFHGKGQFRCCDGRIYDGNYVSGKRHGYGTQTLVPVREMGDPKRRHIGGVDGLYRAYKYSGQWLDDVSSGRGVTHFAPRTYCVDGHHLPGYKPHGHVTVEWPHAKVKRLALFDRGWRVKWTAEYRNTSNRDASSGIFWSVAASRRREGTPRVIEGKRDARASSKSAKEFDNDDESSASIVATTFQDLSLSRPPGFEPSHAPTKRDHGGKPIDSRIESKGGPSDWMSASDKEQKINDANIIMTESVSATESGHKGDSVKSLSKKEDSKGSQESTKMDETSMIERLRVVIEKELSRSNLSNNHFLVSQMNAQMYVPVTAVLQLESIKKITSDATMIVKAVSDSKICSVDASKKMVKPNINLSRNTIILREIPSEATEEEIIAVFKGLGVVKDVRPDVGANWFVTMEDEETAKDALLKLQLS